MVWQVWALHGEVAASLCFPKQEGDVTALHLVCGVLDFSYLPSKLESLSFAVCLVKSRYLSVAVLVSKNYFETCLSGDGATGARELWKTSVMVYQAALPRCLHCVQREQISGDLL